ncbi:MAG: uroporphyrinogen-III synthase [Propioniciclava sp.]
MLETAGARVDEVPFLHREPRPDAALDELSTRLASGRVTWLVATSAFTLSACAVLGHPWNRLVPATVGVAAVGPASAAAVRAALGRVDLLPPTGTGSRALAAAFPHGTGLVVLPGAARVADDLPTALGELGWSVERLAVYDTVAVALPAAVVDRWRAGHYDALVATSGSVADAGARLLGNRGAVVTLGPAGTRTAADRGFTRLRQAAAATPDAVVAALVGLLQSSP